jgi:hypothetical protein
MSIHTPKTTLRSSTILAPATAKTVVAHNLRAILDLTIDEACARTGANKTYTVAYGRLNLDDQIAVLSGDRKLARIVNGHKPTASAIRKFINRAGPDAILSELDRLTAPEPAPITVNGNGGGNGGPGFSEIFGTAAA